MRIIQRSISARPIALVVLIAGLAVLAGGAAAQHERYTHRSVRIPERTEAGTWDGTYWYVNRDIHVALWIRTTEGLPQIRLQVHSSAGSEKFTTDWNGEAAYEIGGGRGEFAMHLTERDAQTMKGTWKWDLQVGDSVRKQRGEVLLHRAGIGREVVLHFDPYEFYIGPVGQERWQPTQQIWTFRKASLRQVRWEELPF